MHFTAEELNASAGSSLRGTANFIHLNLMLHHSAEDAEVVAHGLVEGHHNFLEENAHGVNA